MTTSDLRQRPWRASDPRAVDLVVTDETLGVQLKDGRQISVPITWFPRLAQASAEQRKHWKLIGRGIGIHWPELDEDISVENLLTSAPGE